MANDRLMNATQGDSIITALQTIAQKSESPYHSENKLNPAYIDTGALSNGMTATTQSTDDDSTKLATTAFVHDVVDTLPTPMVYRGTLGTGGTITTLPVDGSADIGDVYKVITAGTYTSQAAKIGDIFICHTKTSVSNTWDYIPAGDDVDVTEVSAGVGLTTQSGSAITTTGTIKAKLQNETKLGANASTVSNPGSLTTNIHPVLTDDSGNLAVKVDKSDVGLGNVTNNAQVKKISSSTSGNIVTWGGTDGATVSDSGKAIATTFANNANQIPTGAAITSGVTDTAVMAGYTIDPSSSPAAITTGNTINEAIGKLEKTASINKNNILSIYDTGYAQKNVMRIVLDEVKALLPSQTFVGNTTTFGNLSVTFNEDNSITLNGSHTAAVAINFKDLSHINMPTNAVGAASANITLSNDIFFGLWGDSGVSNLVLNDGVDIPSDYASKYSRGFVVRVSANTVCNNVRIYPMVCDKALYQASSEVVPYALSNATITPALKECVDNGVKNLLSYTLADIKSYNSNGASWNGNVCTVGNLIFTINSDMSVTVSGSQGTGSAYLVLAKNVSYPAIRFQGCPAGGGSSTYQLQAYYSSAPTASANDNGTGVSVAANTWSEICITIRPNQTFSNPITFKPMAIPQSLYDAGFTDYQPHALSNAELTPYVTTPRTKLVYSNAYQASTTHKYTMNRSDFVYSQFDGTSTCGTYLISVVTWSTTPKHGLWIVSYSGGARSYTALSNIVNPDAATVSVVTNVSEPYIEVTASGKVTISTLN